MRYHANASPEAGVTVTRSVVPVAFTASAGAGGAALSSHSVAGGRARVANTPLVSSDRNPPRSFTSTVALYNTDPVAPPLAAFCARVSCTCAGISAAA